MQAAGPQVQLVLKELQDLQVILVAQLVLQGLQERQVLQVELE